LVEGKKKKLDANAQEVLDTMQGRYHKYQLRVQAHPADSYSGSEIQVDLADYTERPEQVLVKLKMQMAQLRWMSWYYRLKSTRKLKE
jgi:hypothetical protein